MEEIKEQLKVIQSQLDAHRARLELIEKTVKGEEITAITDDLRSSEAALVEIFKTLKTIEEKFRVKYVRRGRYYGIEFR